MQEFVYQIAGRAGGSRPGSHASASYGGGMMFAAHARLFERPDPRRIDLRASLHSVPREWLVRTNYQRSAIGVSAIVDVSASMHFGAPATKLAVAADFLAALGVSAHRVGDTVNLMAFDQGFRDDLYLPARRGLAAGLEMAAALGACQASRAGVATATGLSECIEHLSGNVRLCFLVSDFHWPPAQLTRFLQQLGAVQLVPLVIWHPHEVEAPRQNGLLSLQDAETAVSKSLWIGPQMRQRWRQNVAQRRAELTQLFSAQGITPLFIENGFDAEMLSRYFLEQMI